MTNFINYSAVGDSVARVVVVWVVAPMAPVVVLVVAVTDAIVPSALPLLLRSFRALDGRLCRSIVVGRQDDLRGGCPCRLCRSDLCRGDDHRGAACVAGVGTTVTRPVGLHDASYRRL